MHDVRPLDLPYDLSDRQLAAAFGWARIGVGTAMFLKPRAMSRLWLGDDRTPTVASGSVRSVGGRELALGIGLLMALRHDTGVRGWLEGCALADASDALAALTVFGRLPRFRRWVVLAMAAGGAGAQMRLGAAFE